MPTKNTTFFISDLHLEANNPRITQLFFIFLDKMTTEADALYILGDFFEAYIGDDANNPFLESIKHALKTATQKGLPIYLIHGNRDFLVGERFAKETGITLLPDPFYLNLYDKKIVLMHGDSLCTKDKKYQFFRKIVRNPFLQKLFLKLPLRFREKFANDLRNKSHNYTQKKSLSIMDVSASAVSKIMQDYQADLLIHGHTHKPAIHKVSDTQNRIVLSAWHDGGHYLALAADGRVALVDIP